MEKDKNLLFVNGSMAKIGLHVKIAEWEASVDTLSTLRYCIINIGENYWKRQTVDWVIAIGYSILPLKSGTKNLGRRISETLPHAASKRDIRST